MWRGDSHEGGTVPRYFFDVHDGKPIPDHEGVELSGPDAARKQIWNTLPRMAEDREADGNMACQFRMDVWTSPADTCFMPSLRL